CSHSSLDVSFLSIFSSMIRRPPRSTLFPYTTLLPISKIPNRMQFQHVLQQAIARALRTRTGLALLYLDMDHFKEVNDTFGPGAGDRVLEALTERLTATLPSDTVLGRLAGDEFALFIDGISENTAREVVRHLSREILGAVSQPFYVGGQEVFLSASI